MKEDEIRFFIACYRYCRVKTKLKFVPSDIIDILNGFIPPKRCLYLLEKWNKLGFYTYGISIADGWIKSDKLPERYKVLVEDIE